MTTDKATLRAAITELDVSAPNYDPDTLADLLAERLDNPPEQPADDEGADTEPTEPPDPEA